MQVSIFIFHLSRFGYADYAANIINHLPKANYKIYISKYHSVPINKKSYRIKTYRNLFEFILNSIITLPHLLLNIHKTAKENNAIVAYFLGYHFWDLPIILLCKYHHIKTVYTVHDGILHEGEKNQAHQILQKTCIKLTDELIFLTEFMKEKTILTYNIKKKTHVVQHGLINYFKTSKKRKHNQKLRLLFFGRISKYKGIENLIRAVKLCEESCWDYLTIAGKPLYDLKISSHKKINFINRWLIESEIVELFNTHDVLILPYSSATQSGVITVGVSAGIPMICTKVGGLAEQLGETEAIWTLPNSENIKNAIEYLSKNEEEYNRLHIKMKKKQEEIKWDIIAERTFKILTNAN